jgi:uncharacterized membrane protein YadS
MDTTTSPNLSSNNAALLAVALSLGAVICGAAAGAANADTTPPTSETISIADITVMLVSIFILPFPLITIPCLCFRFLARHR